MEPNPEKPKGDLEALVQRRIEEFRQTGNRIQESHYINLLFMFHGRIDLGLEDATSSPSSTGNLKPYIDFDSLPEIEDPEYRRVAEAVNLEVGRDLGDETTFLDLYRWNHVGSDVYEAKDIPSWRKVMANLSGRDYFIVGRVTGSLLRIPKKTEFDIYTLGDLRRTELSFLETMPYFSHRLALTSLAMFRPTPKANQAPYS